MSKNSYFVDEYTLDKINEIEDIFNFNVENSIDYEPWYSVFIHSLPDQYQNSHKGVDMFYEVITRFDETYFKERLDANKYLRYPEALQILETLDKNKKG